LAIQAHTIGKTEADTGYSGKGFLAVPHYYFGRSFVRVVFQIQKAQEK
jgi:hypothetical protein